MDERSIVFNTRIQFKCIRIIGYYHINRPTNLIYRTVQINRQRSTKSHWSSYYVVDLFCFGVCTAPLPQCIVWLCFFPFANTFAPFLSPCIFVSAVLRVTCNSIQFICFCWAYFIIIVAVFGVLFYIFLSFRSLFVWTVCRLTHIYIYSKQRLKHRIYRELICTQTKRYLMHASLFMIHQFISFTLNPMCFVHAERARTLTVRNHIRTHTSKWIRQSHRPMHTMKMTEFEYFSCTCF